MNVFRCLQCSFQRQIFVSKDSSCEILSRMRACTTSHSLSDLLKAAAAKRDLWKILFLVCRTSRSVMAKFIICAIYKHKFHIITCINLNPPFILLIRSIFIDSVHVVTRGFNRFVIISGYQYDKHCERQRFLWIHTCSHDQGKNDKFLVILHLWFMTSMHICC